MLYKLPTEQTIRNTTEWSQLKLYYVNNSKDTFISVINRFKDCQNKLGTKQKCLLAQ